MERLSDKAIETVNELHTERLDYNSEYLPLIEALNRLAELEDQIEDNRMRQLPCKPGDIVYCLMATGRLGTVLTTGKAIPREVTSVIWDGKRWEILCVGSYVNRNTPETCTFYGFWNDTVFATMEQAEEKLKEARL